MDGIGIMGLMGLKWAVDFVVEAEDVAVAGEGYEFDFAGVAGLETDGCAGGDVEAEAARGGAIEIERGVDLEEMEMAADLDGAVAGVGHGDSDEFEAGIGLEGRAGGWDDFSGDHG
jgi:hypothetical protein